MARPTLLDPVPLPSPPREPRRRALDNPRILVVIVILLVSVLIGLFWLPDRAGDIYAPLQSDIVAYTLYAVDLAILATLVFVLARNLFKLWVEQRRAVPFAKYRTKLVAAMLALTIIP